MDVTVMNGFKIFANEYLSKNTIAFYSAPYMSYPGRLH